MRKHRMQYTIPVLSFLCIVLIALCSILSFHNRFRQRQDVFDAIINAYFDSLNVEPPVPQSFLLKYRSLSEQNIEDFFMDWKQWSDKMRKYSVNDSYNSLFNQVYKQYPFHKEADTTEFVTLPSYIEARSYSLISDNLGWGMEDVDRYTAAKIIKGETFVPSLYGTASQRTLYMTPQIDSLLSEYLGGVDDYPINEERERQIGKRIQTCCGHWGGYWHLTYMPTIKAFHFTRDGVVVVARTSFASGDRLFFPISHPEEPTIIDCWIE